MAVAFLAGFSGAAGAAVFFAALGALAALTGSFGVTDSKITVMWLVRFPMRYARPWARGRKRFIVGPSST